MQEHRVENRGKLKEVNLICGGDVSGHCGRHALSLPVKKSETHDRHLYLMIAIAIFPRKQRGFAVYRAPASTEKLQIGSHDLA
jgi:hypothetical protein